MRRPRILLTTLATGLVLAGATLPVAPEAKAADRSMAEVLSETTTTTVDLFVLRPLSIVRLAFGLGIMLPMSSAINVTTLAIAQDTNVFKEDWDRYVVEPAEYLLTRKLGQDVAGL